MSLIRKIFLIKTLVGANNGTAIEAESGGRNLRKNFREVGDQSLAFISQVLLNSSFFFIMLYASLNLSSSDFLKLAFANSIIPIIAAGLDFGLSHSCLTLSLEQKKQDYVVLNYIIKAIMVLVALFALTLTALFYGLVTHLVLLVAGASMAFWTAARVVEQYAQRFRRYAVLNIALAIARVIVGFAAVKFETWIAVILAVHVIAQIPVHAMTLSKNARSSSQSVAWSALRPAIRLAPINFLSATLFSLLPLIALWVLNSKGDTLSAAAFGVVLMFLAPIDMLFATLKIYVFPKVIEANSNRVDLFGLGDKSMYVVSVGLGIVLILGVIPVGFLIDLLYRNRFPEASTFFLIYFSSYVVSSVIGVLSLKSQRPGFIRLALFANILRAGATASIIAIPGLSPNQIVTGSGAIIIIGALFLMYLLHRATKTKQVL